MNWETDGDGNKTCRFNEQIPCKVFSRLNVGPTINELPGEKRPTDIFQLFISNEMLERIAWWMNEWLKVQKAAEPNKHKAPFQLNLSLILLNWKLTLVYFLQWIKTLIYRNMRITFAKMSPNGFFHTWIPFRLENVGEHFPAKGEGSDHTCQVCTEKRHRFMAVNPDVPNAELPHKLSKTTFKCEPYDVCVSQENATVSTHGIHRRNTGSKMLLQTEDHWPHQSRYQVMNQLLSLCRHSVEIHFFFCHLYPVHTKA